MKRRGHLLAALLVVAAASLALGFSTGPEDGRTNAPSESNCTVGCHSSFALNSGDGNFEITLSDSAYLSGDTIDLSIALADPGQMRWGFEITALDAANQPAGELVVAEPARTQKSTAIGGAIDGREYVKHLSAGTDPGVLNVAPGWTVKWVANNGVTGPVTFFAAGNAANNALGNQGDYIYTTSVAVQEAIPADCCIGISGNVDGDPGEVIDIGDLTGLIAYLYIPPNPVPSCFAEANVDGDAGGVVDIGDLTALIAYLYIPPNPTPAGCL